MAEASGGTQHHRGRSAGSGVRHVPEAGELLSRDVGRKVGLRRGNPPTPGAVPHSRPSCFRRAGPDSLRPLRAGTPRVLPDAASGGVHGRPEAGGLGQPPARGSRPAAQGRTSLMRPPWLEEAVKQCGLPPPESFPHDLALDASLLLPVNPVGLRGVTSERVRQWLYLHGWDVEIGYRRMHGCMVARAGNGVLFYDENDSPEEQRFTVAHELGHFFLDHLQPRKRALAFFGESIQDVLDEKRKPRPEESLSAVLSRVPIGVQIHLMDRGPAGDIGTGVVARSEQNADRLAMEWLAPSKLARQVLKDGPPDTQVQRLEQHFGLPPAVAETYARILRREAGRPRFSAVSFFSEDAG
ncbi:ImmA/IrrE family metallo-endopeptidase [Corallococcus sp. AB050B]|nr:ImmA/IrrE family metallo-endopeptidase [Corallococcus sp. AB050B]